MQWMLAAILTLCGTVSFASCTSNDPRLAAPLLNTPFTHGEIGVLMRKGQDDLLALVNAVIDQMKADGSLRQLHEKYGLVYGFE